MNTPVSHLHSKAQGAASSRASSTAAASTRERRTAGSSTQEDEPDFELDAELRWVSDT